MPHHPTPTRLTPFADLPRPKGEVLGNCLIFFPPPSEGEGDATSLLGASGGGDAEGTWAPQKSKPDSSGPDPVTFAKSRSQVAHHLPCSPTDHQSISLATRRP